MLKKLLLIVILGSSPLWAVHQWMLNISDIDVEVKIDFDLGQFNEAYATDSYFMGVGHISTADNKMTYGNFMVINDLPEREMERFGMGIKVVSSSFGDEKYLATPFGAVYEKAVGPDGTSFLKMYAFYAPGALSFSDARAYLEGRIQGEVEPIENMRAFLGYRYIKTSYVVGGGKEFNNIVYGGIQVGF